MPIEVTILGCGTSSGVPIPGLGWGKCDPDNPKNRRKRVSIVIQQDDTNFLIDAGPDLREQLLMKDLRHIDALLVTHAHADHIHGLDDLRWINNAMQKDIPCFTDAETLKNLKSRFGYVFQPLPEGQSNYHKPVLTPQIIAPNEAFAVKQLQVTPFIQHHGTGFSLGIRVGNFAYCTDVHDFPQESWEILQGIDVWVVDCLGGRPHPTHAHLERVLEWVDRLKPKQTYFTHMNASLDYDTLMRTLPQGVEPAYDGLHFAIN